MADVFIYAQADKPRVAALVKAIEALGLSVWWDERLRTGVEYEREIEQQLDEAKAVVAVLSRAALESAYVRAEAAEAQRQGKLTPVRIEPVKPPLFSRGIQFEDLSDWLGDTAAVEFQDLAAQLTAQVFGEAAASRLPAMASAADNPSGAKTAKLKTSARIRLPPERGEDRRRSSCGGYVSPAAATRNRPRVPPT